MNWKLSALGLTTCLLGAAQATPCLPPARALSSALRSPLGTDYLVKSEDNVCGLRSAKQLSNPARIDYEEVMKATPQMRELGVQGIDVASARGLQMRTAASELVRIACQKVMRSGSHCSIWKAITRKDDKPVTDVTGDVKRQILLMAASGSCGQLKLEKVSFGRSVDRTRKKLEIELASYHPGGMLHIGGGFASVNARWKSPSPEAWVDTAAILEAKAVPAVSVVVCDEATTFGLAASFLVPKDVISAVASEEAVIPVTYLAGDPKGPEQGLARGFAPITCFPRTNVVDAHWAISGKGVGFDCTKQYAMSYWNAEKGLQMAYLNRQEVEQVIEANYEVDNLERALPSWESEVVD